jgi:CDP-4-dehydro-6-deoxyglucose reductase
MNLQFHIALDSDDPVSAYLADAGRSNDLLTLQGPSGSFVLDENSPNSLVFIAEGIGFASIKGLIEHAMALDVAEKIILFWIADSEENHYLNNLCRAWNDALDNFEYVPLTDASGDNLENQIMQRLKPNDPASFDYYLCGGDGVRARLQHFTERTGIPQNQVSFEAI